jgi:hypothetical protein
VGCREGFNTTGLFAGALGKHGRCLEAIEGVSDVLELDVKVIVPHFFDIVFCSRLRP